MFEIRVYLMQNDMCFPLEALKDFYIAELL